jgi:hypothetical protein
MSENAPTAGWYPAPHANNEQRYWDGAQWTDWTPESAAAAQATAQMPVDEASTAADASAYGATTMTAVAEAPVEPAVKKPGLRWWAWVLIAIGALVVLGIIIGAINGGGGANNASDVGPADTSKEAVTEADEPADTRVEVPGVVGMTVAEARTAIEGAGLSIAIVQGTGDDWIILTQTITQPSEPGTEILVTAEVPKPVYTLEQQNALRAAQQYLDYSGFSRAGLIQQLSSEYGSGFTVEAATWAADTVGADWNAEAVESAKSYLEFSAFSRDGLYEQLTSEYGGAFTADEANYALSQVGY